MNSIGISLDVNYYTPRASTTDSTDPITLPTDPEELPLRVRNDILRSSYHVGWNGEPMIEASVLEMHFPEDETQ